MGINQVKKFIVHIFVLLEILLFGYGCASAPRYRPAKALKVASHSVVKASEVRTISEVQDRKNSLLGTINYYIGTPYKYGGEDENGMDCSGLVYTVFREALGIKLPRTVAQQWRSTRPINRDELDFGDLVFFKTTKRKTPSHVGIYIGANRFVHASSSMGVTISSLSDPYWKKRFVGARRVIERK